MSHYCDLSSNLLRSFSRTLPLPLSVSAAASASASASASSEFLVAALPTFDAQAIQLIKQECDELYGNINKLREQQSESAAASASASAASLFVYLCLRRNKRCVLAYLQTRLQLLKNSLWEIGGSSAALLAGLNAQNRPNHNDTANTDTANGAGSASVSSVLSLEENNFVLEYDKLLVAYDRQSGVSVKSDLQPPIELLVEVRVIKEVGLVTLSSGSVNLVLNSTHFILRRDAEPMIRQGILKQTEQSIQQ